MATSSRSAERFKYGICLNDECEMCKTKAKKEIIQEISMRKDLVCAKCGKPLRECMPPKKGPNMKVIGAAAGAAVVLIGIGLGLFFFLSGDKKTDTTEPPMAEQPVEVETGTGTTETPPEPVLLTKITPSKDQLTLTEGDKAGLSYTCEPTSHDETITTASSDESVAVINDAFEVEARKAGTATITISADKSGTQAAVKVTVNKKEVAEKNPSWGRYEGARNKSGQPHGNGVLYITRSYTINGETAQPGERIEGVFRDGYLNLGTWYKKDGNAVVVKSLKVL